MIQLYLLLLCGDVLWPDRTPVRAISSIARSAIANVVDCAGDAHFHAGLGQARLITENVPVITATPQQELVASFQAMTDIFHWNKCLAASHSHVGPYGWGGRQVFIHNLKWRHGFVSRHDLSAASQDALASGGRSFVDPPNAKQKALRCIGSRSVNFGHAVLVRVHLSAKRGDLGASEQLGSCGAQTRNFKGVLGFSGGADIEPILEVSQQRQKEREGDDRPVWQRTWTYYGAGITLLFVGLWGVRRAPDTSIRRELGSACAFVAGGLLLLLGLVSS